MVESPKLFVIVGLIMCTLQRCSLLLFWPFSLVTKCYYCKCKLLINVWEPPHVQEGLHACTNGHQFVPVPMLMLLWPNRQEFESMIILTLEFPLHQLLTMLISHYMHRHIPMSRYQEVCLRLCFHSRTQSLLLYHHFQRIFLTITVTV